MREDVSIREIILADAAAAAVLSTELGYPTSAAALEQRIRHLSIDHAVYVACLREAVAGWVDVGVVRHLQVEPYAEIGGLVISSGLRSLGIGRQLLLRAEQWARSRGLSRMLVRSRVEREAAHRFYVREGYHRTKTSAVFSKDLS